MKRRPLLLLLLSVNFFFVGFLIAQKTTIAVIDLNGIGVTDAEATIISSRLRTELFKTNKFIVVEREKMKDILQEQGFQLSGCTSDECIVEAGKLLGVKQIVAGEIGKLGKLYTLTIRLVDVETGRLITTATSDCRCSIEDVLLSSVKKVAFDLSGTSLSPSNFVQPPNDQNIKLKNADKNELWLNNPEIRYAESLYKRKKYQQAKNIIQKYINSGDASSREEAMAMNILWGLSKDKYEEFEKFKAFFPNSSFIPVINKKLKAERKAVQEKILAEKRKREARILQDKQYFLTHEDISISKAITSGTQGTIKKILQPDTVLVYIQNPNYIFAGNTCFFLRFMDSKNRFKKINTGKIIAINKHVATVKLISSEPILPDDRCIIF